MPNEYTLWKRELRQAIESLRAINLQSSTCWLGAEADGSSFHQAITYLYQECKFPHFLTLQAWRQAGLSTAAGEALQELKNLLDAYDEPDSDHAIAADPQWQVILRSADQAIELLDDTLEDSHNDEA